MRFESYGSCTNPREGTNGSHRVQTAVQPTAPHRGPAPAAARRNVAFGHTLCPFGPADSEPTDRSRGTRPWLRGTADVDGSVRTWGPSPARAPTHGRKRLADVRRSGLRQQLLRQAGVQDQSADAAAFCPPSRRIPHP